MSIKTNVEEILEDIKKYSPYPEKVKLVAVTKYSSVEDIEEFLETGQNICGENKVQVIKDKIEYFKEKIKKLNGILLEIYKKIKSNIL